MTLIEKLGVHTIIVNENLSTQIFLILSVQKLHLPPELSDTASRSQEDPVPQKTGCGTTTGKSKLDF